MSDPVKAIVRRLHHNCRPFAELTLDQGRSEQWNSLLFDGGRHRLDLCLRGSGREEVLDALPVWIADEGFTIPGHLIADIRLVSIDHRNDHTGLCLEALTIADDQAVSV